MAYDVFISYPYQLEDDDWVQSFYLSVVSFYPVYAKPNLKVFINRESAQMDEKSIQDVLASARIFIPLLSPGYFQDERCRREFLFFLDQLEQQPATKESCRILPIEMEPVRGRQPAANARPEIGRMQDFLAPPTCVPYVFWENAKRLATDSTTYVDGVVNLVNDIHQVLEGGPTPAVENDAYDQTVFLALASKESQRLRKSLLTELQRRRANGEFPCRILPDEGPFQPEILETKSKEELEQILNDQIGQSLFSVHFFDDVDGPTPNNAEDTLITHLQYEIARSLNAEHSDFQFFVRDAVSKQGSFTQKQFIKQVNEDLKEFERLRKVPDDETTFKKTILYAFKEHQKKLEQPKPDGQVNQRVFLVHDYRDKDVPVRRQIQNLIRERQYSIWVPVFPEDMLPGIDLTLAYRERWVYSSRALVLLSKADSPWCKYHVSELVKMAIELKRPSVIAVCVTEPNAADRIEEVQSLSPDATIINCTENDFPQKIAQFLNSPLRYYA